MKNGTKHNMGLLKVDHCLAIRNNTRLTRSIRLEENYDLWDRKLIFCLLSQPQTPERL